MATGWGTGAVQAASALGIPTMGLRAAQTARLKAQTERDALMAPLDEQYTRARIADLLAKPEERAFMRSMQLLTLSNAERQRQAQRDRWKFEDAQNERRHQERMQAAIQRKVPSGYQMGQDGQLQMIPGGPADIKYKQQYETDSGKLQGLEDTLKFTEERTRELLAHEGLEGITGWKGMLPDFPQTALTSGKARDANALLNTLKTRIFTSALQEMRANSPTGGALGNVSNLEGNKLEQIMGALERAQTLDQFKTQLKQLADEMQKSRIRLRNNFNRVYAPAIKRYGQATGTFEAQPSQGGGDGLQPGHIEEGYRFKGGDPSDKNNWEPVDG